MQTAFPSPVLLQHDAMFMKGTLVCLGVGCSQRNFGERDSLARADCF